VSRGSASKKLDVNSAGHPESSQDAPFATGCASKLVYGAVFLFLTLFEGGPFDMKLWISFLLTLSLCGLISAQEHSASNQSKQATLMSGLGDLHHPVSTSNVEASRHNNSSIRDCA
jgi:hypothetical protein